jgi:hypothetical protein
MTRLAGSSTFRLALVLASTWLLGAAAAHAAGYPTNVCVGKKQKAAGVYCKKSLKAWAKWDQDQDAAARDATITDAAGKLATKWGKAEEKSEAQGADCVDTTLTATEAQGQIDSAVGAIVGEVNDGLDLGSEDDATCGKKLLTAAAVKCGKLLIAESVYVKDLAKDPDAEKRDGKRAKASETFEKRWAKAVSNGCPTTADVADVESRVDAAVAGIVTDTTVSPNVDDTQFITVTPGPTEYEGRTFTPVCMNGSPYAYFAKRGTVNKLLVYYQGGGACWENLTCSAPVCDTNVNPAGGDNPNNQSTGFADMDNPANPFRDWNVVFVSYCSCDVHYGDAAQDYSGIFPTIHVEHRGYHNARVVEKWTREHFVNPEEIFVTGSSAGAYGAWFNAVLHHAVWPASHVNVLADAGNGVITQEFLDEEFPNWNFEGNLPDYIPGLQETLDNGTGIPGYTKVVTAYFPETRWAHYTSAFDGNTGGQSGFYNVMLNPDDLTQWPFWWNASCEWNEKVRAQSQDIAAAVPSNYRYYIGTGSRHTMWGSNKVYTDVTGGVPTLVDWVNGMLAGSPAWTNVECTNCGLLLAGDPRPSPLQPPFTQVGPDVVVECPSSPSGAFVDATLD